MHGFKTAGRDDGSGPRTGGSDMSEQERLIWTIHDSPVGPLTLVAGPEGIRNIHFPGRTAPPAGAARGPLPALADQLDAYFAGQLRAFDVDLDVRGNRLQLLVWRRLLEIPYGATTTYGELARRIDGDAYPERLEPYERARVVGAALGRNPVPVVVPCHRVIGADGSLVGFGGGLERKRKLLELEGVVLAERARRPTAVNEQLGLL
jgi:methylated-DNA-[protein]-cysteine S-methyltransferase